MRQSDEDTLAILQEAKRADHSMQVPAWADDVMEVDISPTPVSSMDNEAADWAITADELKVRFSRPFPAGDTWFQGCWTLCPADLLWTQCRLPSPAQDMLACIDVAQEASSPTPAQAPQGLGGMRLPGGGAARHGPPRLSPAASTGSSGGFDPLGWKSHPVPASSAVSSEVVHVSASSEVSSAPMGLGLGGGLNPRRRK